MRSKNCTTYTKMLLPSTGCLFAGKFSPPGPEYENVREQRAEYSRNITVTGSDINSGNHAGLNRLDGKNFCYAPLRYGEHIDD